MEKKSLLPFVICITILLALFAQEGLLAKSVLFLDVEQESRSCEIRDYNFKKSSLKLNSPGDAILPVLAGPKHFYAYLAVADTPACSRISLPFICRLFNHSPPSFL
jgi:hypothetical protein